MASRLKNWESLLNRREFVSLATQSGLGIFLSACAAKSLFKTCEMDDPSCLKDFLKEFSPINRTIGETAPRAFSGDEFELGHQVLWDLPQYFATHKVEGEVEEVPLVIIGGGVSGLFSAYTFRKHQPVLLEQASRFGGNAKGQSWQGIDYSIGAAYIDEPTPGTPMHKHFTELKLREILTERSGSDPVEYNGKLYSKFWEGETQPAEKDKYHKLEKFFSDVCNEKQRAFPLIPSLEEKHLQSVKYYDQFDLHTLLSKVAGGKLPTHLETAIEYYCWSTYGASSRELSSAAGVNFLAQESRPILVPRGGNSGIAERVLEYTLKEVPTKNLRARSLVVNVKVNQQRVDVQYIDAQGKLRQLRAKCAIMSCPKFIASKILRDLEPERKEAISKLKYRSYMVANLLLKKKAQRNFYDLFMIGDGKTDLKNLSKAFEKRHATDFILANFASPNDKYSVFTFYCAFPFDGARTQLIQASAYELARKRFEKQIAEEILPLVGAQQSEILDLRLTRWGHALPLAPQGIFRGGSIEKLRKPFQERVFFIEQDNWAYPSLQTGATEVLLFKDAIQKALS